MVFQEYIWIYFGQVCFAPTFQHWAERNFELHMFVKSKTVYSLFLNVSLIHFYLNLFAKSYFAWDCAFQMHSVSCVALRNRLYQKQPRRSLFPWMGLLLLRLWFGSRLLKFRILYDFRMCNPYLFFLICSILGRRWCGVFISWFRWLV